MGGGKDKDKDKDKKNAVPKNWPANIPYLTSPRYSPKLTPAHLLALRTRPPTSDHAHQDDDLALLPADRKLGPSPLVRITPITDAQHPAHGQAGLFAARDLPPGSFVVAYVGEVHRGTTVTAGPEGGSKTGNQDQDPHAHSDYDLWLDREADLAVDAARAGNEARFVNDYRGVPGRTRPNAEFRAAWDARRVERAIAVFVLPAGRKKKASGPGTGAGTGAKGIVKGEEILVSYGKGFWGMRKAEEEEGEDLD